MVIIEFSALRALTPLSLKTKSVFLSLAVLLSLSPSPPRADIVLLNTRIFQRRLYFPPSRPVIFSLKVPEGRHKLRERFLGGFC